MAFGRLKKNKQDEAAAETAEEQAASAVDAASEDTASKDTASEDTVEPDAGAEAGSAGFIRDAGPFDSTEKEALDGYIDLGALRIGAAQGLQLRLEVEERTKRVIAVTLDLNGSTLQLQAFAAPRTGGIWDDIREQIGLSVGSQGGTVEERAGTFGTELMAKLPAKLPDGQPGHRVARFVGVDGPRWFLRGVFGGRAAIDAETAAPVEALFRSVVVVRGDHPLPPRELLPLRLPKDAQTTPPPETPARPDLNPLERGPEITEIR
ncbi:DUF3710 domain-containing protein [Arthrobacter sp. H41]|uniref:DUF3710 domain-containing protein n=1 Tax=Arthrobacter sp. H41 TaxID=1312978 RepID=UPI00047C2B7B|nr:DUF3710 domain-containing protein [Arthrobacter sp. H41]